MADNIRSLTDYEHVRLRTPMYLGSVDSTTEKMVHPSKDGITLDDITFTPALLTMMGEVIDNAVDEVIGHKSGNRIDVTFDPDTLTLSVFDNGRGVPLDKIQLVFSSARAGRNFDQREDVIGANGIGASAVNFVSKKFEVDVWRDGKHVNQVFEESKRYTDRLKIGDPTSSKVAKKRGTRVEYTPSDTVFPEKLLPAKMVEGRVRELAFAYPEITWTYNGEKLPNKGFFGEQKPVVFKVEDPASGFVSTFYVFPQFHSGTDDHVHAIVNSRCAWKGGEHIKAFRSVFYNGLGELLKKNRGKIAPNKADIAAGLLIFNVTRMKAPTFDSQSKTFLASADSGKFIKKGIDEALFKKIIRQYPEWIESIYERFAKRTGKSSDNDAEKATKAKAKVAKLTPANGRNRMKCILILGEGDSALTKAVENRNPEIHGILPLRGKVMNAVSAAPSDVFKTEALLDIVKALGLVYGKKAIPSDLNYGQVWIATDEDVDGDHILCLLIAFFYKFWPELFRGSQPFISKLNTPFFIVKKGNTRQYFYSEDEKSFDPSKYKGSEIVRAKGLGKLENPEWKDILHGSPSLTPIFEDADLKETIDLLFNGDRADDRKVWLSDGSK